MLSNDELDGGTTFILKLWDGAGKPSQWVETLRGATAKRWYQIYRRGDWNALRAEAASVFRNDISAQQLDELLHLRARRVYIHTLAVRTHELTR
jgi:hypothetical protein